MESALVRVQSQPDLLRGDDEGPADLCFYRVNKHLLVFDHQPRAVVLLTVIHASRGIPKRLAEMEPTLSAELDLLHNQFDRSRKPA